MKARTKATRTQMATIAFILSMIASSALILPSLAQTTRIYMVNSDNTFPETTPVGTKFNVTMWVGDASRITGANIYIEFDDELLNVTRWFVPDWDTAYAFYGKDTTVLPDPPDDVNYQHFQTVGYVVLAVGLNPFGPNAEEPFSGTGKLMIVEFNMTKGPPPLLTSYLSFTHVVTISLYSYLLEEDFVTEVPNVTLENGSYTFIPEFTPILMLSMFTVSTIAVLLLRRKLTIKSARA